MALNIPLDKAAIVSTVLEGILYGFSLLMFCATFWSLTHGRITSEINKLMFSVALLLLFLSTTHMVIDVIRIEQGLVVQRNSFPGGPSAFFADVTQSTFISKNSVYTLQTLLGDGVLIYRCYKVWQSFWVIVLPCLLWCSVAATGVGTVYTLSQATSTAEDIFAPVTYRWVTSFYATTLATNLLSTTLLAFRIWSIDRQVSHIRSTIGPLRPVLRVVRDSGLLYSVALVAALSTFAAQSTAQYVVLDMVMPIISIAFYMVIIHVQIARSGTNSKGLSTDSGLIKDRHAIPDRSSRYLMSPVQVQITTSTETNDSSSPPSDSKFSIENV